MDSSAKNHIKRIVLDDETLKLFLERGWKITKVHRILEHKKGISPVPTVVSTADEAAKAEFYAEGMRNKRLYDRESIKQMENKIRVV